MMIIDFMLLLDIITPVIIVVSAMLLYYQTFLLKKKEEKDAEVDMEEIVEAFQTKKEFEQSKILENFIKLSADNDKLEQVIAALNSYNMKSSQLSFLFGGREEDSAWKTIETLITEYHHQALEQANIQFIMSILSAGIGFLMIIYSLFTFNRENWTTIVSVLPGAIIDSVALLFYSQTKETRQRATLFYDSLNSDNRQNKAITLVNTIDNDIIRNTVKAQIATYMVGLTSSEIDLPTLINGVSLNDTNKKIKSG